MSATIALLRAQPIFATLDDDELGRIGELCEERVYASEEQIFREGEPGNRLFIIIAGEVRISRDVPGAGEEALAVLKAGAVFGEMAVFDRSRRSTDAIAQGDTRVLTISRAEFEMLLDLNRDIAYKVLWSMVRLLSARLRSTNESLRSVLAMAMF